MHLMRFAFKEVGRNVFFQSKDSVNLINNDLTTFKNLDGSFSRDRMHEIKLNNEINSRLMKNTALPRSVMMNTVIGIKSVLKY